ncbi:MAG: acyltransferase family protein [Clostridia bacterium]|nr:acyltransferase family protein [Clostridia bacterium]
MQETQTKENVLQNNNKPYFWGLDLIRIIAMFFVILVHSTSFYGFKEIGINSFPTFLAGVGRYLSFTCIPLFLILTSYLNYSKQPSKKYYIKITKFLIEFILCGIAVTIFNKLYLKDTTPPYCILLVTFYV